MIDHLAHWKSQSCLATHYETLNSYVLCVTSSGVVVHEGDGCKGCPYA